MIAANGLSNFAKKGLPLDFVPYYYIIVLI